LVVLSLLFFFYCHGVLSLDETTLVEYRQAVKNAFDFSYSSYESCCFGHDEIRPLTNDGRDEFGGMGASIIDSLDLLIMFNMTEKYNKAREFVKHLDVKVDRYVSVFETIIRHVGGLIAAYEQSNYDEVFLIKAIEIANALRPAFNSPSGYPYSEVNMKTGETRNKGWHSSTSTLSEVGTMTLEFFALSYHSKDPLYASLAHQIIVKVSTLKHDLPKGLFPCHISTSSGQVDGSQWTSLGAMGDSFYEYLIKTFVYTNNTFYKTLYENALSAMKDHLLTKSSKRQLSYFAEFHNNQKKHKVDHLTCFSAGMVGFGWLHLNNEKNDDLQLAKDILATCVQLYQDQPTGLGPEIATFQTSGDEEYRIHDAWSAHYFLRPETVESLFYLHRLTGDDMYQKQGWAIFQSIEKHCKTTYAYSGIRGVNRPNPEHNNVQESFFYSETLKYLYLLFTPNSTIDLKSYVFNTEGHPLKIHKDMLDKIDLRIETHHDDL